MEERINFKATNGDQYIENMKGEVNVFNKKGSLLKTIKLSKK